MSITDVSSKSIAELISLKGRTAVVTGAAQGLGKAIANRFAEVGASVLIADLKDEQSQACAQELAERHNTRVLACHLDVADEASVTAAAAMAQCQLGGLDIWVNNAGLYPNASVFETSTKLWDDVMAVNVRGAFYGARAAAEHMIKGGRGGVIINIVSTAGFRGVAPVVSAYVASKHAVQGLTRQMAIELASHDIRVVGVAPTFCETEGNMAALAALPEKIRTEIAATTTSMLGRVGVPDDIARSVLFCASDLSLFMTGSTLMVDAGEIA